MTDFLQSLKKHRIVMIYRGFSSEQCLELTEHLLAVGIRYFEVTMNTPDALRIVKLLATRYEQQAFIGAGTVTTVKQVEQVADAGGTFLVSPHVDTNIIERTKKLGLNSIPGAFTPTEILAARNAGGDIIKVFPIKQIGADYIKQFRGPFADIPLMPTGGITLDMVQGLMQAGGDAIGLGAQLLGKEWIESRNWTALKQEALHYMHNAGVEQ